MSAAGVHRSGGAKVDWETDVGAAGRWVSWDQFMILALNTISISFQNSLS